MYAGAKVCNGIQCEVRLRICIHFVFVHIFVFHEYKKKDVEFLEALPKESRNLFLTDVLNVDRSLLVSFNIRSP